MQIKNTLSPIILLVVLALILPSHDTWTAEITANRETNNECVILLHGLARTSRSMAKMAECLEKEGYSVINVDYDSRHHRVEELAEMVIPAALADSKAVNAEQIHFVTHSLGGIVLRHYLSNHEI